MVCLDDMTVNPSCLLDFEQLNVINSDEPNRHHSATTLPIKCSSNIQQRITLTSCLRSSVNISVKLG